MSSVAADIQKSPNPLRNPAFATLFAAQVIALVGTGLSTIALTLLAYDLVGGNAAQILGVALAFKMVAYVFFAPVVGGLAHRFARKPFLIAMDVVRAGVVLAMPFVTEVWQIYVLIFVLNLFSAGFKPVFAATIPDILPDDRSYTRALSMSRLAYDLENLLSPTFAALALLIMTYTGLFIANSLAFLISAALIIVTVLPQREQVARLGNLWSEISFGTISYFKTPRLRALLALYLGVASASSMVIVNTVIYVKDGLGDEAVAGVSGILGGIAALLSAVGLDWAVADMSPEKLKDVALAMALAASGGGSMIAALSLPKILDRVPDRPLMLLGGFLMAVGVWLISTGPGFPEMLSVWFFIGIGWSLVQTPAGRVVNRSSSPADRSAFFSAQFALSHACWLIFYLVAGFLGTRIGIELTAQYLAAGIVIFTIVATRLWPRDDAAVLLHEHPEVVHKHVHRHDEHHEHGHEHTGVEPGEMHTHEHRHRAVRHAHDFVIDDHHASWPASARP